MYKLNVDSVSNVEILKISLQACLILEIAINNTLKLGLGR